MTTVRVAIVQSEPAAGVDESLHRTEALVREAAALAKSVGRPVATCDQAAAMINLPRPRPQ